MITIHNNTPIEEVHIPGSFRTIHVKREDLCCGGPAFSKMRGVAAHLSNRPETFIGVLDTFHSKAGWGVSYLLEDMDKKAVVFYPVYKGDKGLRYPQFQASLCGARIVGIDAGRSCILYHKARKMLAEYSPDSYLLPNGLKCPETVAETAREVYAVPDTFMENTTWVISMSSGTVAAGVIRGLIERRANVEIYLHMGYSRSLRGAHLYISEMVGSPLPVSVKFVDEKYEYKQGIKYECPFPCNPFYDLKAWRWLMNNHNNINHKNKIMFWNIGA